MKLNLIAPFECYLLAGDGRQFRIRIVLPYEGTLWQLEDKAARMAEDETGCRFDFLMWDKELAAAFN